MLQRLASVLLGGKPLRARFAGERCHLLVGKFNREYHGQTLAPLSGVKDMCVPVTGLSFPDASSPQPTKSSYTTQLHRKGALDLSRRSGSPALADFAGIADWRGRARSRSEEHTSELQ